MAAKKDVEDKGLTQEISESAHRIWLAGLGALSRAEEEGGKLFQQLVDKGREMEKSGRQGLEKTRGEMSKKAEALSDKLDEKLSAAMTRMGVPTREEIGALSQRVDELNAKLERLKTPSEKGGKSKKKG